MAERVITATGRGFLLLDAHPTGCARTVEAMADQAGATAPARWPDRANDSGRADAPGPVASGGDRRRPVALIVGCSAGYGLATTITGIVRHGIDGLGVCLERPPSARRTATAGWYRAAALADLATRHTSAFGFLNADAFADATKEEVTRVLADRFGGIDHLIYSVAAPRRTHPDTGITHSSVIKPVGAAHHTRTLTFDPDGTPRVSDTVIEPATDDEIADTVHVMGGDDWSRWIDALAAHDLLRPGFTTAALTYIGSPLTAPIYRNGSIGAAKAHLEDTARALNTRLAGHGARAWTSVNGVAVTQASAAIPGVGLYGALVRAVLGERMRSPIDQSADLWNQIRDTGDPDTDDDGRIRLDRWELTPTVLAEVASRWDALTPDTVTDLADTRWLRGEFHRLYGFDVPGVDYTTPVETDVAWPTG